MLAAVPHAAALNPRGFRAHAAGATHAREVRAVVDGCLLQRYAMLDTETQRQLALHIGTTPARLVESIASLDMVADTLL
jgi:cleavage and polyadenylation specificity factor subunit 1